MSEITDPRYDSKPTQPKDPVEMTHDEETELFNATLDRDDVADMIWDTIIDGTGPTKAREIVKVLFRLGNKPTTDFMEVGRLIHSEFFKRVHEIVDDESSNTDMGKD